MALLLLTTPLLSLLLLLPLLPQRQPQRPGLGLRALHRILTWCWRLWSLAHSSM